ncbi:MAG: hypothetical protein KAR39_08770 [Thermoplasmata archaeon]|nr:hypothetical protein [Thermoplasmata archaeon]
MRRSGNEKHSLDFNSNLRKAKPFGGSISRDNNGSLRKAPVDIHVNFENGTIGDEVDSHE